MRKSSTSSRATTYLTPFRVPATSNTTWAPGAYTPSTTAWPRRSTWAPTPRTWRPPTASWRASCAPSRSTWATRTCRSSRSSSTATPAFIGQGVVQETLNLSQLEGYKTGGTIHIIVNNQIGFTTGATQGRSTGYATDLAKGLQVPILHVNADDPEAVIRCAHLAFEYRNAFHKDVIIDMVCYRRRGHNEGDDPSMTQPVMYSLIDRIPSTRAVYIRGLVGRGQLTEDEARQSIAQYEAELGRHPG